MNRISFLLSTACSAFVLSLPAALPQTAIPEGAGVNIHFVTGHDKDLDLIAAAGLRYVRMDFAWAGIERQKKQYDWSGYEELLTNLEKRKLSALFILDYSNPLYEETVTSTDPISGGLRKTTSSPQKPESVAAFARWAGAAAKQFRGRPVIWEIWNEPNIHFWAPKPDVQQYIALAAATCKAVREADPNAIIVAPATSGFPWEFLEDCFKAGLLSQLDAVSVHPYRDYKLSPETAAKDYQRLRELITRYAPAGKKVPILSGEWGYATHKKGISLETQAAFAVRQQLSNLLCGVPLSIWYDWKNDGPDPEEREHNFGLVNQDLSAKPAYEAIQVMIREMKGYQVAERLPLASDQQFVLVCTNSTGSTKMVAWSAAQPQTLKLQMDSERAKRANIVSGQGKSVSPAVEEGKLVLELGPLPAYISFGSRR